MFLNKTITIKGEFVSCTTCAVCYDQHNKPTYCQYFNTNIDETEKEKNHKTASGCKRYCPKKLERHMVLHPEKSDWELPEEERINLDRSKKLEKILE